MELNTIIIAVPCAYPGMEGRALCNRACNLFCLAVFVVTMATALTSLDVEDQEKLEELDRFIKHTVECRGVPGLAISLVKNKRVVFAHGYGHADIDRNTKATKHTKFCIGSLTKAFTTTLIADILSKHKNITWDTPIRHILGRHFRLSDKLRTDHVTLRDLLAHKVCTPSNFNALLVGFPADVTREDLVRRLKYMPAVCDFRTDFHYSNYMYMLAGHVVEAISGESWEDLISNRIFETCGMKDSGFVDKTDSLEDIATPYVHKQQRIVHVDKELLLTVSPSGPAGSIFSTATDMAHWMQLHLKHGRNIHGQRVIDPVFLQDTYKPQMAQPFSGEKDFMKPTYPISDTSVSYNMGWMTSVYRGYPKLWHSGGIVTFTSHLWMFPELSSGLFVTVNGPLNKQGSRAVKAVSARAADFLIGEEPWLNISTSCSFPAPWEDDTALNIANEDIEYHWNSTKSMYTYIGRYGNRAFGDIEISVENQSLTMTFGRFGKLRIFPSHNDSVFHGFFVDKLWYMTNSDDNTNLLEMQFEMSSDSKVTGLLFPVDMASYTLFRKNVSYIKNEGSFYTSVACSSGMSTGAPLTVLVLFIVTVTAQKYHTL